MQTRTRRRGVTLLEMLVAVALLVLMMTVMVSIFSAATGAVTAQRVFQELDGKLRRLDSVIRQDLTGATARFTPPLDPRKNLGYFEYGENAFADSQGEDTDDYIRLTVKAPDGQPFSGRIYLLPEPIAPTTFATMPAGMVNDWRKSQPVTITSQFAEVIYFLRSGNLYRRVFLVAPEVQGAVNTTFATLPIGGPYFSGKLVDKNNFPGTPDNMIPLSWQGVNDLSAHPSAVFPVGGGFTAPILNTLGDLTNRENRAFYQRYGSDLDTNGGRPDDLNADGLVDYPRTFYPQINAASPKLQFTFPGNPPPWANLALTAFPYIYPGAYSVADPSAAGGSGRVHSLDPSLNTYLAPFPSYNHAPLPEGDNWAVPSGAANSLQTWWGFPLWRETLAGINPPATPFGWNDPWQLAVGAQMPGMSMTTFLPPVLDQPFNDGAGTATFTSTTTGSVVNPLLWDDDLIMTGVRSFDVKAYDNAFPGYVDLGWGDDTRITAGLAPFLTGNPVLVAGGPSVMTWNGTNYDTLAQSFAHEGRMPPLTGDLRFDAQFGQVNAGFYSRPSTASAYTGNIGDNNVTVTRLRRVWDTWSTDYSQVPARAYDTNGTPIGPPFYAPIYPSYPAPYPQALRGIQIQIRVVDPRNERIKVLTIRQDFSDKL